MRKPFNFEELKNIDEKEILIKDFNKRDTKNEK